MTDDAAMTNDDAWGRLVRDCGASGVPQDEWVRPEQWPVLTGDLCTLRVLDEADAPLWHRDEDTQQLVDQEQEFYVNIGKPRPDPVPMAIRLNRVAWTLGGGHRHFGVWTDNGTTLAGGVLLNRGGMRHGDARIAWVVWGDLFTVELAADAIDLAATWSKSNLAQGSLFSYVDADDLGRQAVLERAGFRDDGTAEHWELDGIRGRIRYVR